ncbi:hypothetical protein LUZ60_003849 [Juncus effusus]|nr:hypothetical protein LUZ60_003849 [Juncus effusus]
MLPQMGAAAESISKASSLVLRIGTDAHLYDDPNDVSIKPLLESRYDSEKADALKRLLALIAQGADVSHFFPQVVKNVASHSLEVKKLVYLYLLHYAEKRQNEALLSINCFQKDLSDTNPLVRAWALRAMTGIRLHIVSPLLLAAIAKSARDPSPYVRKCAAYALMKLYNLHQEENSSLEELVDILLSDSSPSVIGSASVAFNTICPDNHALISKHFTKLCHMLPDVEEWAQVILIQILLRYVTAKHGLVRESILSSSADLAADLSCGPHALGTGNILSDYVEGLEGAEWGTCSRENEEVELLMRCTRPLMWSRNSAVVMATAGAHWLVGSFEEFKRVVKPLVFLLRSSPASKYVVLCNVIVFAKKAPELFEEFYEDFFVLNSDPYQVKTLKLEILSTVATEKTIPFIFEEFQDYIRDPDRRFVADTIASIGICAKKIPNLASTCIQGLLTLVLSESSLSNSYQFEGENFVLVQAIMSIKSIIKQDPSTHEKVIIQLVKSLDTIKDQTARALIIWILGEYNHMGNIIPKIIPTVLKYLAWSFKSEESESKLQIINTCTKVVAKSKGENSDSILFNKILNYTIQLAKVDSNYDVRDRARFISNLMTTDKENSEIYKDLIENILFTKPSLPLNPNSNFRVFLPGSLSQVVLHAAPGYSPLPNPGSAIFPDPNFEAQNPNFEMNGSNGSDGSSEYSDDESESGYSDEASENGDFDESENPLVNISDGNIDQSQRHQNNNNNNDNNVSGFVSADLAEMLSRSALESWLDEKSTNSQSQLGESQPGQSQTSAARVSFTDRNFELKPRKCYVLLDPVNSEGLRVRYAFSNEVSNVSPLFVCVDLLFENFANEALNKIDIKYEDEEASGSSEPMDQVLQETASMFLSDKTQKIIPMEEIITLNPNETVKRVIQVRFNHHLLPLKLRVYCNGKKHTGKLWPDIAYFLRPLNIDLNTFLTKEGQLNGMFEYSRRCIFKDHVPDLDQNEKSSNKIDKNLVVANSFASKMLSNANIHLVSMDMPVISKHDDVAGLCLRFSGELLNNSKICLITVVTMDGNYSEPLDVSVKINCEDTVFGLNLLNRVVAILQ